MYLLDLKKTLKIIGSSGVLYLLLLYLIYGFEINIHYISNTFFFTGISYFLVGLIMVTNCTEVFSGVSFLTKRLFVGSKGNKKFFKSYGEYKEFKELNKEENVSNSYFYVSLIIGLVYIIISIILGYL